MTQINRHLVLINMDGEHSVPHLHLLLKTKLIRNDSTEDTWNFLLNTRNSGCDLKHSLSFPFMFRNVRFVHGY